MSRSATGDVAVADEFVAIAVVQERVGLLERDAAVLGEASQHHRETLRSLAREPAHAGLGDGDVDEIAELRVQDRALVALDGG